MAGVCAEQGSGSTADGEPVTVCLELHAERPFVRPPADVVAADGPSTLYLAALNPNYSTFVGRDGMTYAAVGADGLPLPAEGIPASLHAGSQAYLYLLYRVTGTVGPGVSNPSTGLITDASIQIDEAVPAILIDGRAIDGAFLGPWEGTVSERAKDSTCFLTTPCWDERRLVPLRVTFSTLEQIGNIADPGTFEPEPDGELFAMVGNVDNLTDPVLASDGKCIASLVSLGKANPFRPATNAVVKLYRVPSMHTPGDDELVLDYPADAEGLGGANGMSPLNVLHPANLMLEADSPAWDSISIHNHGTPNFSEINLHPVSGGGGACTP